MRALTVSLVLGLGTVLVGGPAAAQTAAPASTGPATTPPALPPPAADGAAPGPSAAPAAAPDTALPPPAPASGGGGGTTLVEGQNLTGAPNPTGLGASTADEWRFSSHGFFRAPMRIGIGSRPKCPAGTMPGTNPPVDKNGNLVSATNMSLYSVPCASAGQSSTALHTPFTPDNQYLDWRYIRQQEYDWTEVFLNYGNSRIQGTVSLQAFGFTDAEHFTADNITSQLGIAQGWVTVKPDPGVVGLRMNWKVGAFWDKYGMAGKYDAGKYDTYLFGRTHQMGETFAAEYDVGDFTLRASHGIGIHNEAVAYSATAPGDPGFSLVHHAHVGISYKKVVDFNLHYINAWSQDFRPDPKTQDGSITVTGAEARFTGGLAGELYLGYSHVSSDQPQRVGPILEVNGALGGAGYSHNGGQGLVDNYFGCKGGCGAGATAADHGTLDTVEVQYDYGFGALYRKLTTGENFWGDGWDVNLSVFGMFTKVGSNFTTTQTGNLMLGDGVTKLKYGADLIVVPFSWMGIGVRADVVQPTDADKEQSFWVASPKLIFKTKFVTHEEITAQYSHYSYGKTVLAQPPNATYFPDENTVGLKGTLWW